MVGRLSAKSTNRCLQTVCTYSPLEARKSESESEFKTQELKYFPKVNNRHSGATGNERDMQRRWPDGPQCSEMSGKHGGRVWLHTSNIEQLTKEKKDRDRRAGVGLAKGLYIGGQELVLGADLVLGWTSVIGWEDLALEIHRHMNNKSENSNFLKGRSFRPRLIWFLCVYRNGWKLMISFNPYYCYCWLTYSQIDFVVREFMLCFGFFVFIFNLLYKLGNMISYNDNAKNSAILLFLWAYVDQW